MCSLNIGENVDQRSFLIIEQNDKFTAKIKGVTICHMVYLSKTRYHPTWTIDHFLSMSIVMNKNKALRGIIMFNRIILFIVTFLTLVACGNESNDGGSSEAESLNIVVHAVSGHTHISCSTPFALADDTEPNFHLKDLRMFVHDVELKNTSGEWVPYMMDIDGEWSDGTVTLLDFEDGAERCDGNGNLFMNHQLSGTIANGEYQSIRFRIGVPHELNHQDVTMAKAPLNTSSMFWVWQKGYKFARIELLQANGDDMIPWMLHLGSTGCESAAVTIAPEDSCARVNSPFVTIENFNPVTQHLVFDMRELLKDIDLTSNTEETPGGCMSMPLESLECTPLYQNLGLEFETGTTLNCGETSCNSPFKAMNNDHTETHDSHDSHDSH